MKLKLLLLHCCALLLGSCCKECTISEHVPYPKTTRAGIPYTDSSADFRATAWWTNLHDPLLNNLIAEALATNNSVKSAYAAIDQAKAQLKAAQYAWIPTLDASFNGFGGRTWNTDITPLSPALRTPFISNLSNLRFKGYYTGFVPSYTFNIVNNIYNTRSAKASLAMQKAQMQSVKLSVISQVSGTYFMLLSQREQLATEKALVQDLKKLLALEKIRFKKGASNIETVTSLDQQAAQEMAKIPPIENVIAQSENTIRLLLNKQPGVIRSANTFYKLQPHRLIPKSLPSSVLKNRPDIKLALDDLRVAAAQVGVAYSAFFPTIALNSLVGGASVDLSHLLTLSSNVWVAQAAASTKLFNAASYQAVKGAKAAYKSRYFDYLNTLYTAFADVDNALTNEQKNRLALLQNEKAYEAARQSYSLALTQYKAGATDYRKVLNAKINLEQNRLQVIQAKAQLLDALVQVYSAVAGGYDFTSMDS